MLRLFQTRMLKEIYFSKIFFIEIYAEKHCSAQSVSHFPSNHRCFARMWNLIWNLTWGLSLILEKPFWWLFTIKKTHSFRKFFELELLIRLIFLFLVLFHCEKHSLFPKPVVYAFNDGKQYNIDCSSFFFVFCK
jgi:hypothetical protein